MTGVLVALVLGFLGSVVTTVVLAASLSEANRRISRLTHLYEEQTFAARTAHDEQEYAWLPE